MKLSITPHTRLLLGTAALSVLATVSAGLANAQTPTQPPASTPQTGSANTNEQESQDRIIIVGTNIEGAAPVGSEPIVVGREEIGQTGLSNISDVIRRLPQVQFGGVDPGLQGGTANQGYNGSQTESINLRGLGSAATLVLVDGRRRVAGGAASTTTDANQVPLAALERIEVLTDGASAVYGSDAVAGVVNFVTRRDFDGLEATLRWGNQSGGAEYNASLTGGITWDNLGGFGAGNILATFEHQDRNSISAGKIARVRRDLRPLGGPDLRIDQGNALAGTSPNIISQGAPNTTIPRAQAFTYWGVPAGNGTGLTAASLALNQPNLADISDYRDYIGAQTRDQLGIWFNQEFSENVELFADFNYTNRETVSRDSAASPNVSLAGSPFFIAGLPANQQAQYSIVKDGRIRTFTATSESIGATVGARFGLWSDWEGDAYYTYGRNEQCDSCAVNGINLTALQAQVTAGNINPLSSVPLTDAQAATFYGDTKFQSRTILNDVVVKANGTLFDLPGGALKAAVGVELRNESNANDNKSRTGVTNALTTLSTFDTSKFDRDITSAFAELNIPVVSSDMGIPLVDALTVSAAVRYDDYSDFGDTTNPRFGFTWDVTSAFRFSGTWGTSFRAPSVTDANPKAVISGSRSVLPNFDPRITNGVLPAGILGPFGLTNGALLLGSNTSLRPETSENWSVSANYSEGGLELGATLWNIDYTDQILFPGTIGGFLAAPPPNYGGWGAYIIPINNPVTCNNADITTADPVLQPFLQNLNYDFLAGGGDFSTGSPLRNNFCSVNVVLDSRIQNVGSVLQRGLDLNASYTQQIGEVDLTGRLAATRTLKNDVTSVAGAAPDSQIGELSAGYPSYKWSGTASLTGRWKDFDATLSARYLHSILGDGLLTPAGLNGGPNRELGSYTTLDFTLGYGQEFDESMFGMTRWRGQFVVTNLADEEPDFFVDGGGAWNRRYGLPFGRTYSVSLTAAF